MFFEGMYSNEPVFKLVWVDSNTILEVKMSSEIICCAIRTMDHVVINSRDGAESHSVRISGQVYLI